MERILNDDEKMRKAEEIYYRRNNQNITLRNKTNNKSGKFIKDKIFLQLIIMINIVIIIFCIQNKDFIFTKEFLGVLNQYNTDMSAKIVSLFSEIIKGEKNEEINIVENNNEQENQSNNESNIENDIVQTEENNVATPAEQISSSVSEMEMDIQNLNAAYSFIKPIEGVVSSGFGARESEYQNVTGYHTGVDIAAEKGTPIKASMQGIVTLVSSVGDYGKHVKIRCNNVTTLYAHCSKIYVKEGQIVAQGQDIAAVGSTGNSTGPHLHFEIRVDDRFVDASRILNF